MSRGILLTIFFTILPLSFRSVFNAGNAELFIVLRHTWLSDTQKVVLAAKQGCAFFTFHRYGSQQITPTKRNYFGRNNREI